MSLTPYLHLDLPTGTLEAARSFALADDQRHHLTRVLRLRDGAQVVVADGRGGWAQARLQAGGSEVSVDGPVHRQPPPRPQLTVAQGLAKGRKVDEVVRTCTELGADAFVPLAADRSVVSLDDDKAARLVARWRAVARSAAEQARRPHCPEVGAVGVLADLLDGPGRVLVAHPDGDLPIREVGRHLQTDRVTLAVGPEGGWSGAELDVATHKQALIVRLGPGVLRTEHAAAALLTVCAVLAGRWD